MTAMPTGAFGPAASSHISKRLAWYTVPVGVWTFNTGRAPSQYRGVERRATRFANSKALTPDTMYKNEVSMSASLTKQGSKIRVVAIIGKDFFMTSDPTWAEQLHAFCFEEVSGVVSVLAG
jgi:hypothetical protein